MSEAEANGIQIEYDTFGESSSPPILLIMGSTGNPELPQAKPEAIQALTTPPPTDREEYIDLRISSNRVLRGPGYPFNEERIRERAALAYDRSFYPEGRMRQMVAIMADGNRKPALQSVTAPTLVIHGADDPLVPVEGGKDTAEAISGSAIAQDISSTQTPFLSKKEKQPNYQSVC